MICESKKTIKILKASIFKCKKVSFSLCKISKRNITQSLPCAAGENFEISSISIKKYTNFTNVWGNHMLRVCLGILKNLPQYAYIKNFMLIEETTCTPSRTLNQTILLYVLEECQL